MSLTFEEREWLGRACRTMGPLPEKCIVIDVETSGLNHDKDVALQVAIMVSNGQRYEFESFTVDWVTGRDRSWHQHLDERLERTRTTIMAKGGSYAFTLDRLKSDGIPPAEAAERLLRIGKTYGQDYWLVTHNGMAADIPFTDRLSNAYNCTPISATFPYIDTMTIERGIQVRPKIPAKMTWPVFSGANRMLGGSAVRCNLREHCSNKYHLPVRQDHEADRDAVKTMALMNVYRKAVQNV